MGEDAKKYTVIDEAAFITPEMWERLEKHPAPDYLRCKGMSQDRNPDGTWGPWYSWCDEDGTPRYKAPNRDA